MPGIVLGALRGSLTGSSQQPCEQGAILTSILKIRKLRFTEVQVIQTMRGKARVKSQAVQLQDLKAKS